jgi:hypothetical protein
MKGNVLGDIRAEHDSKCLKPLFVQTRGAGQYEDITNIGVY